MLRSWTVFLALVSLFLPAAAARAELPPLIPREVLFGNPVKSSPQISPDGKRLSYVAPDKKLYLQDNDGDENFHVYSVNLADSVVRDLTPFQGVRAQLLDLNRDF